MNNFEMNSRELLKRTLNHQDPGRIVTDFGSTSVTGLHVSVVGNLRDYFGLEKRPVRVIEPFQMLGEVDDELVEMLGVDVVGAWGAGNLFGFYNHGPYKEWRTLWGQDVLIPMDFNTTEDLNGDFLIYPEGDTSVAPSGRMPVNSYFFDAIIRQESIVEEELSLEKNLQEYGLVSEADLQHWKIEIERAYNTGKGVAAALGGTALGDIALIPGMQLKNPQGIRDVAEWYMSTVMRSDFVKSIFDRQTDIAIENLKRIYEIIGNKIDVVFLCGTDFGTQDSTFCAPEQFDDMWLPYYRKVNNWIHQNTQWKTFKHSCGAVETFMSHFIEAGFDIINPVQINAKGMDPKHLKETYGKELVFWGGGIDTQKVLPFGTPSEVREQVLRTCEIFGKDGGFVFNTVHNLQANVPIENIVTMYKAIKEFNGIEI